MRRLDQNMFTKIDRFAWQSPVLYISTLSKNSAKIIAKCDEPRRKGTHNDGDGDGGSIDAVLNNF